MKFLVAMLALTLFIIVGGILFAGRLSSGEKVSGGDLNLLVADKRNNVGNPDALVKIVEFGDFQCPACATAEPIVAKMVENNKDKILFVFRHFPLPAHKNAIVSSRAAEAAGNQGKFFEMYKVLYQKQKEWEASNNPDPIFEKYGAELGLDMAKYKEDFDKAIGVINKDSAEGNKLGVDSTPTFFINGQKYVGVINESKFQQIIDSIN